MVRYTDSDLLDALDAVTDELGHLPSADEMNAHDGSPSASTYRSRFGSWNEALAAAGFDADDVQTHDLAALRAALAWLTRELGRVPSPRDMDEAGRFSASAYRTHFGSWEAALTALNLSLPSRHPRLSNRQLIADLQSFANYGSVGGTMIPSKRAMDTDGPHSSNLYTDRFGSWSAALIEAGLDPRQRISRAEITAAIHDLAERVGCTAGGPAPAVVDLAE